MTGIYNIGIRSLLTFESALSITAHNIENANTPYFARRQVNFVEAMFNNGVSIANVRRVVDDSLDNSVIEKASYTGRFGALADRLNELESILDSKDTNINKFLEDAIVALQELTTDVGSVSTRSNLLNKLKMLTNKISSATADIENRKAETNKSINQDVSNINELLSQLAEVNSQLNNGTGEHEALLDQQYKLLADLSEHINFKTYRNDDGSVEVSLENGLSLVRGSEASTFSTSPNSTYPATDLDITLTINGKSMNVTNQISSGSLKGLMEYKTNALDTAAKGLGRLSLGLQDLMNKQNNLGIDLNGDLGGNIFNDINSTTLINSRVFANINNIGSVTSTVSITDAKQLTTSDYELSFDSATHYQLVRKSDKTVVSSGDITSFPSTIAVDGFSMDITAGSFNAGDKYTISPTAKAAQSLDLTMVDPKKLALGFPVTTSPGASNKGNGTMSVTEITDTSNSAFSISKQLNPPIRVEFLSDNSYQLVNANTSAVIEGPIAYDENTGADIFPTPGGYDPGYRINLSGHIKSGDTFNVSYNTDPSADNRNAVLLSNVLSNPTMDGGKMTFTQAYQTIASSISSLANSAQVNFESATIMLEQAQSRRAQRSGVSISEEAINMTQLQEAYAASAQVIQTAKNIFDILLNVTSR